MAEDFEKQLKEKDAEISKLKESIHSKEEDIKKMMKAKEDEEAESMKNKKKKVVESIMSMNKELKEEELMSKSLSELELMESYEKKIKDNLGADDSEGVSEVQDTFESGENDIVFDKKSGNITLSESARLKFNDEIKKSIYR